MFTNHLYTVLAVDDTKDSLSLLESDLNNSGYHIITTDSGEKALEIMTTTAVDLVLLDMQMPGLSGLETLKRIKANPIFDHIPIIMLSASEEEDPVVAALEIGANDYVTKPYIAKILLARMKNALVLMEKTMQLEALAATDFLTKVNNRGSFENRVNKIISQAKRSGQPVALAMFDLDYFKKVNDNFGHEAGDKALVEFAQILLATFRDYDIVGRIGGEEFAVCMPNTCLEDAFSACERGRKLLANTPIALDGDGHTQLIRITVSIGLVSENTQTMSYEDMLRSADHLLYQAKENGRNQTKAVQLIATDVKQEEIIMAYSNHVANNNQDASQKFPGIEYQIGINNVLGDEQLFAEILLMFYQDHGSDIDKIERAINNKDHNQVKHLIHTLKGVACSIGAMALFERAKALDMAASEGQEHQYHNLFAHVKHEMNIVLSGIKSQLADKV